MPQTMETAHAPSKFWSERLTYRGAEPTEEILSFIHNDMDNDPATMALGDMNLVRPAPRDHARYVVDQLARADLGVIIYAFLRDQPDLIPEPVPIGYLSLGWGGRASSQSHQRQTTLGISIAAPYQDQGFGGEAITWAVDWAFCLGGFHRINVAAASCNYRALHLYKKLGFVEEGRSREAFWYDRKWFDIVNLGMIEGDWVKLRDEKDGTDSDRE